MFKSNSISKQIESVIGNDLDKDELNNLIYTVIHGDTKEFNGLMEALSERFEIPTAIYKIRFSNNSDRTIKQRLESEFYFIYLLTKKKNKNIRTALINVRGYRSIKINKFFDIGYYLKNNPDVRESGDDPIMHYIYYGFKEGRNPSTNFLGKHYIQTYSDVKKSNLNPLIHYSVYGIKEGRYAMNSIIPR